MQSISTIGLDIAKSVFQVHGVDAAGQVVLRRQRRHGPLLSGAIAPLAVISPWQPASRDRGRDPGPRRRRTVG